MELSSPKLKNFLYFRRELAKPENQTFHIACLLRELLKYRRKRKKFLILSLIKKQNFLN